MTWIIRRSKASLRLQKILVYGVVAYVLTMGLGITLIDNLVMPSITWLPTQ